MWHKETGTLGPIDAEDVVKLNNSVARVLQIVAKKDDVLRKKLSSLLAFKERWLTRETYDWARG